MYITDAAELVYFSALRATEVLKKAVASGDESGQPAMQERMQDIIKVLLAVQSALFKSPGL